MSPLLKFVGYTLGAIMKNLVLYQYLSMKLLKY